MALWVVLALMLLGVVAILLEIFVPAGGILGAGGLACIVYGVVQGYAGHGPQVGTILLVGSLVVVPALLYLSLRLFPRSWLGRKLILAQGPARGESRYGTLVEREGVAVTDLRPSGVARFGDSKVSVVTAGEYVGRESRVRVLRVEGSRIVVARVRDSAEGGS